MSERGDELGLEGAAARRGGSRLVQRDHPAAAEPPAEAKQRLGHRGRMVGVVVEDVDPLGDAPELLPARDAGEAADAGADGLLRQAERVADRDGRQRVPDVVRAAENGLVLIVALAGAAELETAAPALHVLDLDRLPGRRLLGARR